MSDAAAVLMLLISNLDDQELANLISRLNRTRRPTCAFGLNGRLVVVLRQQARAMAMNEARDRDMRKMNLLTLGTTHPEAYPDPAELGA